MGGEHAGKGNVDRSLRVSDLLGASGGLRALAGLSKQCVAELSPRPYALTRVCYRTNVAPRASVTMPNRARSKRRLKIQVTKCQPSQRAASKCVHGRKSRHQTRNRIIFFESEQY